MHKICTSLIKGEIKYRWKQNSKILENSLPPDKTNNTMDKKFPFTPLK